MKRALILSALGLLLCSAVALAADDGSPSPDLSGVGGWLELALKVGVPTAGLGGVIYWLLRYHVPELTATFRDSLKVVMDEHKTVRAEDRSHHSDQIEAIRAAIAAEGAANRDHREAEGKRLRQTLTGMSRSQLRVAEADEDAADDAVSANRKRTING